MGYENIVERSKYFGLEAVCTGPKPAAVYSFKTIK